MADTALAQAARTVDIEYGQGCPDPRALALAGELQHLLPEAQVLVFGSRATGTWRPGSDIDLAVIGGDRDAAEEALAQIAVRYADLYGQRSPRHQLVYFARAEFAELRVSRPHIAGQVQRYGLKPNGEHLPQMAQKVPWPSVQEFLQASCADLAAALKSVGPLRFPRSPLYATHGALEKILKATLAAEAIPFEHYHDVEKLAGRLPVALTRMLEGEISQAQRQSLVDFRTDGPYAGSTRTPWPETGADQLLAAVRRVCVGFADHILAIMGKRPDEVGYEEWLNGDDALGGWGTLALDHFRYINTLRSVLDGKLVPARLDDVQANWNRHGVPADAIERIVAVMTNPDTWKSLFVKAQARDTNSDQVRPPRDRPPKGTR